MKGVAMYQKNAQNFPPLHVTLHKKQAMKILLSPKQNAAAVFLNCNRES